MSHPLDRTLILSVRSEVTYICRESSQKSRNRQHSLLFCTCFSRLKESLRKPDSSKVSPDLLKARNHFLMPQIDCWNTDVNNLALEAGLAFFPLSHSSSILSLLMAGHYAEDPGIHRFFCQWCANCCMDLVCPKFQYHIQLEEFCSGKAWTTILQDCRKSHRSKSKFTLMILG